MELFVQLGLFYWKNLERASKEGKNRDTFPWKVGWWMCGGRHSDGRKYEQEVRGRVEGGGRIAARQRDRQEV